MWLRSQRSSSVLTGLSGRTRTDTVARGGVVGMGWWGGGGGVSGGGRERMNCGTRLSVQPQRQITVLSGGESRSAPTFRWGTEAAPRPGRWGTGGTSKRPPDFSDKRILKSVHIQAFVPSFVGTLGKKTPHNGGRDLATVFFWCIQADPLRCEWFVSGLDTFDRNTMKPWPWQRLLRTRSCQRPVYLSVNNKGMRNEGTKE